MKPQTRASLAAVALGHAGDRSVSSIYDYAQRKYLNVDVRVASGRIDAYDYSARCHLDGTLPSLYHYGDRAHIDLKPTGNGRYSGYDYGTRSHFDVTVSGKNVEIYDCGASGYFSYSE